MSLVKRITPEDAYRRRWQLLALTSIGAFMAPLDGSIVAVALPSMGKDLHLTFTAAIWVQAAYLLTTAVLLIPVGRLADEYGRVRFYLLGIAVFTLGSLLAALSMNGAWLIGSRIVQGAGSALMFATAAAIVTAVFPPKERGRALGINVMAVYLGLSLGPPLGGLLVDTLGWRSIFLITCPSGWSRSCGAWSCCRSPSGSRMRRASTTRARRCSASSSSACSCRSRSPRSGAGRPRPLSACSCCRSRRSSSSSSSSAA